MMRMIRHGHLPIFEVHILFPQPVSKPCQQRALVILQHSPYFELSHPFQWCANQSVCEEQQLTTHEVRWRHVFDLMGSLKGQTPSSQLAPQPMACDGTCLVNK